MILPHLLWLIPALPLLGAAINGVLHLGTEARGKTPPKALIAWIACGAMGLSFLLVLAASIQLFSGDTLRYESNLWDWVTAGQAMTAESTLASFTVPVGFSFDGLTAVMTLVVTFVGALIHVYSVGYMGHDEGFGRFFSYLNLFCFFMLVLVMGNSFPLLFVGWEGVGLCSYLLIGFYYREKWPQDASVKAFVTNRIGDFGFMLAMLWIFLVFGSLHFPTVFGRAALLEGYSGSWTAIGIAILLFVGATGKSAQIPLYVWLPDAMAGPTPVSALIHAATMVTAGVYMTARCTALFAAVPEVLGIVAVVGALTALLAASMGLVANDIKKVLAYSTVSQLGYMFLGVGVGAAVAGIFHLMTHAFFKALLFLGAGSVIHSLAGEQDIWKMGGMRKWMRTTGWTFWVACLAIAGIIPFAGFFSKDEILYGAWSAGLWPEAPWLGRLLWACGVGGALMTAFYMWRLYYLVFSGEERWRGWFRGAHGHGHGDEHGGSGGHGSAAEATPHESPRVMTVPLVVLALGAIFSGFLGLPHLGGALSGWNLMERAIGPVIHEHAAGSAAHGEAAAEGGAHAATAGHGGMGLEILLMGISLLVAIGGILLAKNWYEKKAAAPAEALARRARPVYRLLFNRWFVDEIYWSTILWPYRRVCEWLKRFDERVVDGGVNGSALFYKGFSVAMNLIDRWVIDLGVNAVGWTSKLFAWTSTRLQTGFVANYMIFVMFGVFLLACVYMVL